MFLLCCISNKNYYRSDKFSGVFLKLIKFETPPSIDRRFLLSLLFLDYLILKDRVLLKGLGVLLKKLAGLLRLIELFTESRSLVMLLWGDRN
jgi:hypothetical protein